ncbi:aldehyde dehydrogenase family protein [Streptomyces sp. NPDC001617]
MEDVYDEVLDRVTARAATIRIADPLDESTELGPLALQDQPAKVESYVRRSHQALMAGMDDRQQQG